MNERTSGPERNRRRWTRLRRIEGWLELPMVVLGLAWLLILVLELTRGVRPWLQTAATVIWIIFIVEFLMRLVLAPRKLGYLKSNWLTAIALAVPALRIFRVLRVLQVFRAARGLRLFRVITGINRGMRALGGTLGRRGFGYVVVLTTVVILVGGAGMYAFENLPGGRGLNSYGEAVWWTAMIMTTLGSQYWPQTAEGQILCFLLAVYALGVFGYITATLASFFIGQDVGTEEEQPAGEPPMRELRREISALRRELRAQERAGRSRPAGGGTGGTADEAPPGDAEQAA